MHTSSSSRFKLNSPLQVHSSALSSSRPTTSTQCWAGGSTAGARPTSRIDATSRALWRPSLPRPAPGDVLAGVSVALVLVPQSLAYAQLAGMPAYRGLYAAALPPLAAAFFASSPYLQTGPVALTALLTFGALAELAPPGSGEYVSLGILLALVVGFVRLAVGLLGAGVIAYLVSQPMLLGFVPAAAILDHRIAVAHRARSCPARGGHPRASRLDAGSSWIVGDSCAHRQRARGGADPRWAIRAPPRSVGFPRGRRRCSPIATPRPTRGRPSARSRRRSPPAPSATCRGKSCPRSCSRESSLRSSASRSPPRSRARTPRSIGERGTPNREFVSQVYRQCRCGRLGRLPGRRLVLAERSQPDVRGAYAHKRGGDRIGRACVSAVRRASVGSPTSGPQRHRDRRRRQPRPAAAAASARATLETAVCGGGGYVCAHILALAPHIEQAVVLGILLAVALHLWRTASTRGAELDGRGGATPTASRCPLVRHGLAARGHLPHARRRAQRRKATARPSRRPRPHRHDSGRLLLRGLLQDAREAGPECRSRRRATPLARPRGQCDLEGARPPRCRAAPRR